MRKGNEIKGINPGMGLPDVREGTDSGILGTRPRNKGHHPRGAGEIWEGEQCPGGVLPFRFGQRQSQRHPEAMDMLERRTDALLSLMLFIHSGESGPSAAGDREDAALMAFAVRVSRCRPLG